MGYDYGRITIIRITKKHSVWLFVYIQTICRLLRNTLVTLVTELHNATKLPSWTAVFPLTPTTCYCGSPWRGRMRTRRILRCMKDALGGCIKKSLWKALTHVCTVERGAYTVTYCLYSRGLGAANYYNIVCLSH